MAMRAIRRSAASLPSTFLDLRGSLRLARRLLSGESGRPEDEIKAQEKAAADAKKTEDQPPLRPSLRELKETLYKDVSEPKVMAMRAIRRSEASLPSTFPSSSTSAAACGWRRLLSGESGQPEDDIKGQEKVVAAAADAKSKASRKTEDHPPTETEEEKYVRELKETLYKESKEQALSGSPHTMTDEEYRVLISMAVNWAQQKFDARLKAHRMLVNQRFYLMQKDIDGYSRQVESDVKQLRKSCDRRAKSSESELDRMKTNHDQLNKESMDKVQETQYTIVKMAAGVGSVVAILFAIDHFFY